MFSDMLPVNAVRLICESKLANGYECEYEWLPVSQSSPATLNWINERKWIQGWIFKNYIRIFISV